MGDKKSAQMVEVVGGYERFLICGCEVLTPWPRILPKPTWICSGCGQTERIEVIRRPVFKQPKGFWASLSSTPRFLRWEWGPGGLPADLPGWAENKLKTEPTPMEAAMYNLRERPERSD